MWKTTLAADSEKDGGGKSQYVCKGSGEVITMTGIHWGKTNQSHGESGKNTGNEPEDTNSFSDFRKTYACLKNVFYEFILKPHVTQMRSKNVWRLSYSCLFPPRIQGLCQQWNNGIKRYSLFTWVRRQTRAGTQSEFSEEL